LKLHLEDIKHLLQGPSEIGPKAHMEIIHAFSNLYAALKLPPPNVICFDSPFQLQMAIKRSKGQSISLKVENDSFRLLDDFLAHSFPLRNINAKLWDLVGNRIARPLFLAFGNEDELWQNHQSLRPAFQQIEDAIDRENSRLLSRDELKTESLAHHPNWRDHQWLESYQGKLSEIPLSEDLAKLYQQGLMQAYCYEGLVMWCPKPVLVQGELDQLHAEDGPALMWHDHYRLYYWHGVPVPSKLIEAPELISRKDIEDYPNAEIRRCFQEKLGTERFASLFDLELIDSDLDLQGNRQFLYRSREIDRVAGEYIQFAKVICPTTHREYFLCVPPHLNNVWDAVAWTFAKDRVEYKPKSEV